MNILITICARGGSKGIPGKNIRPINNIPLIAYSIKIAKQFATLHNAQIELSTDDLEIKNVAAKFDITNDYLRPEYLANDTAGKIEVIADILLYSEKKHNIAFDYVLDLDVTSPLRTLNDLIAAFSIIDADANALNLFSVNLANRNPYFNMVEQQENGYFDLVKTGLFLTRQSAPKVYDLNASFYFYRRIFFNKDLKKTITSKSLIYEMPHICFDLDHIIDFEFMQYLIETNKLGFEL